MPVFENSAQYELPYLPALLKEVVQRTSAVLSDAGQTTPFEVSFAYGLTSQVWKELADDVHTLPMVWLVMGFDENIGRNPGDFYETPVQLLIMSETEPEWTMAQRETQTLNRYLFPIYHELLKQISTTKAFGMPGREKMTHTRTIRPYWGGGEPNSPNKENLFKKFVDAIEIRNLQLKVRRRC